MRQHKRGVLLQLLRFFVEDGIGACSPFVSPTTHNRIFCLFRVIVDAPIIGMLYFPSSFFPLRALNKGEPLYVPMPIAARVFGYGAVSAHARTQMHQPVSPCTIPRKRLINRSGAVALKGLAVVAVIGERT
jgi:hypothetical protein